MPVCLSVRRERKQIAGKRKEIYYLDIHVYNVYDVDNR